MKALALAGLLVVMVTGCGDGADTGPGGSGGMMGVTGGSSSGGNSSGGSGGTPGTGGGSGKARGAVSMHIIETPGCSLVDQYQDFPIVPGGRPVTAAGVVKMLEDGNEEDGQEVLVSCSIRGDTPPYQFRGYIATGQIIQRSVNLGARLAVGMPGVESLVLATPDLPDSYAGAAPEGCTYTATELDPAAGKVRGHVVCGTFQGQASKDPCKTGESYFAFENCSN